MGTAASACVVEDNVVPAHADGAKRPGSTSSTSTVSRNNATSILREWSNSFADEDDEHKKLIDEEIQIRERPSTARTYSTGRIARRANRMRRNHAYFRNYTKSKGLLYFFAIFYVVSCSIISIFQPLLVDCHEVAVVSNFENPGYAFAQTCHHRRYLMLLFMTPEECAFGRRIVSAAVFGALIGWERRQVDRPAGIRTMSLVSLGSCLFSICGTFAFIDGPMGWDASRISAAIPSGVGFLGAGIIWKQTDKDTNNQSVHGLTTAASLWLSAAVGIACAGELYFAASFAIAVMMILLRFGPRIIIGEEEAHNFSSERDIDDHSAESSLPSEYIPTSIRRYNSVDSADSTAKSPVKNARSKKTHFSGNVRTAYDVPSIRE